MKKIRVFVSFGTHEKPFLRLLNEIKKIKKNHDEFDFFIQAGNTCFNEKEVKAKSFLNQKEFLEKIENADIIVGHAGAGIIINSLKLNKKLILVPRLKKFNEHSNNHQKELALKLSKNGFVISVLDINYLEKEIFNALNLKKNFKSTKNQLINDLKEYLINC